MFMILGEKEILRGVLVFVVGGLDGFLLFLILDSGLANVGLFVGGVPVEFDIFVVPIGRLVVDGVVLVLNDGLVGVGVFVVLGCSLLEFDIFGNLDSGLEVVGVLVVLNDGLLGVGMFVVLDDGLILE